MGSIDCPANISSLLLIIGVIFALETYTALTHCLAHFSPHHLLLLVSGVTVERGGHWGLGQEIA